ncbi:hypothetical protein AB0G42_15735 [Streptomyces yangpuensis]|uniref:three-helix bundle dimerization domain-containing protein n=1 Tax=Streptomyces yangpuensis TaxID=1648182 RepID=UPI003428E08F
MSFEPDEAEAIRRVAERLKAGFLGRRTAEQVDAAVRAALDRFEDSKVRNFIPVLVERRARAALEAASGPDRAGARPHGGLH